MYENLPDIKIIAGFCALCENQQAQFKQVTMEGLKGKFAPTLQDDTDRMLAIIDAWIQYDFLPMDQAFCATDGRTGDVLAILLLNNFIKPGPLRSILCLFRVIGIIGLQKALKIAFHFLAIDNLNKEKRDGSVVSEIYLVSTREDLRGKGVGTLLINHVLEDLRAKRPDSLHEYQVKLLVFAKNPARKLYERLGFQQIKAVATPKIARAFGDAYDGLVHMEKPL